MQNTQNTQKTEKAPTITRLVGFEIDSTGVAVERDLSDHERTTVETSLLPSLYPDVKIATATVPMSFLDACDEASVSHTLSAIAFNGVTYRLAGGTSSTKDGEFKLVDEDHIDRIKRRFRNWAESALTSVGILLSPLKTSISVQNFKAMFVPQGKYGTNDSRAWLAERVFEQLGLPPHRMYQFRWACADESQIDNPLVPQQAKGCFKVMSNDVADLLGVDMVLPDSCCKPGMAIPRGLEKKFQEEGLTYKGPALLGVRDTSEVREFRSSYQLIQYAPKKSILEEIIPETIKKEVAKLASALNEKDHRTLVQLLGVHEPDEITQDDEMPIVVAALLADGEGQMMHFPYVANQILKALARWVFKVRTGGGIVLPGFTLTDDGFLFAHEGKIYSGHDWMPRNYAFAKLNDGSKRVLCARYPIRGEEDLLPFTLLSVPQLVEHLAAVLTAQGCSEAHEVAVQIVTQQIDLEGCVTVHGVDAQIFCGDFDFDLTCLVPESRFPIFVEHRFNFVAPTEAQGKTKVKSRSPWRDLPRVAMAARGNQIGRITDLMTSCIAAGKKDLAHRLKCQLQYALDSLKWSVKVDPMEVEAVAKQISRAPWLEFKRVQDISKFPTHIEVEETDLIGLIYNEVGRAIPDLSNLKAPISDFKSLVLGPMDREKFAECKAISASYAAVVGRVTERQTTVSEAFEIADLDLKEARQYGGQKAVKLKKEARQTALAKKRASDERTKREFRLYHEWLSLWAASKPPEERRSYLQAMLTVACSGTGTGAILFHTFPQELIDALAAESGGIATRVQRPKLELKDIYKDPQGRVFHRQIIGDGQYHDTLLFLTNRSGEAVPAFLD